ncbi:hypothetical protein ABZ726_11560 [Streptomyces hundungensis]|uniref:hypothetical protein n=1 Tax=Streptomyces hundungensis TaxID=1077946 RepID=UPI0033DC22DE
MTEYSDSDDLTTGDRANTMANSAASPEQARQRVSTEIRDAIKDAAPRAVYPDDEFEGRSVRVAGWDPEETRSNEALLRRGTARLSALGWQVFPEATDSDDRSALVFKEGLANGRLYASNRSLTFTGDLEPEVSPPAA